MDIFNTLTLIGGLCLFLFGMNVMGQALERRAGGALQSILSKLTANRLAGFATGLGVTAVIQSSSATTVMVVGFVNSGLMTLRQSINVIMGANVGTTVTAWILSLGGIEGDNLWVRLLKPTSFTPVLALVGIILYMFCKQDRKKDTGTILLGFAVLMFGMETMTDAVSGLADLPAFQSLFVLFENPLLGVLAGAVLTAVIQSSSASVGILQALAATGAISYGAAVPIIMGQNIGTCITALLSCFGANRNAKRAALVHFSFNIIGTAVWLSVFAAMQGIFAPTILGEAATQAGIAIVHSVFNLLCTALLLPASSLLEKLVCKLIPDRTQPEPKPALDDRLLATPAVALRQCRELTVKMGETAVEALTNALTCLKSPSPEALLRIREAEEETDQYEDTIGTFLVKLSSHQISDADGRESAKILKMIGDLERLGDHAKNLSDSAEECLRRKLSFTPEAEGELERLTEAVREISTRTLEALKTGDGETAATVEPLEQVIDLLKEQLRNHHILRLQQHECGLETGFVWSDILTDLERAADHCSNIAGCIAETEELNLHADLRRQQTQSPEFDRLYQVFAKKYL